MSYLPRRKSHAAGRRIALGSNVRHLRNLINGEWMESQGKERLDVDNPASGEVIATVPLSTDAEIDDAVQAACTAFPAWRDTPAVDRGRLLFRLQALMRDRFEDLSRTVVVENGKTLDEARGEVLRAVENVELAAGIPTLQMGSFSADISATIDEHSIREPLGVFAQIGPFNFPAMVPFWFAPLAVACGNTFVMKPSERTPLSQTMLMELVGEAGFPSGVLNLVHGSGGQAQVLSAHPEVAGVSFVGSTPVARAVYETATHHGKRAQCQGGAKNHLVVMPDAELDAAIPNICGSTYGCAGQRCLAGSVVVTVGDVRTELTERLVHASTATRVGDGLDPTTGMGPVISAESRDRAFEYIDRAVNDGAHLLVDGREIKVDHLPHGHWVGPTVLDNVTPDMAIARDEIFGPVISMMHASTLHEAIEMVERNPFGNAATLYTNNGGAAREFARQVNTGNVGINVGVAAPMAFFPFGGRKDSFFGDIHAQSNELVRFYTDPKVIITRWPGKGDGRDPWD